MSFALGICVAARELRAVLADRRGIRWGAIRSFDDPEDLAAALARLAADLPARPARVRVVLAGELVQLRSVVPAPPVSRRAARRYVALEAPRLFRMNGRGPLVTDALMVRPARGRNALWAAAAPEPVTGAVVRGCAEAGLRLDALGVAAEVLPWAAVERPVVGELSFPTGAACERISIARGRVWRGRLVPAVERTDAAAPRWAAPLAEAGETAPRLAAAYGATRCRPAFDLLPPDAQAARWRAARRRVRRIAAVAAAVWCAAAVTHLARLGAVARDAERQLERLAPAVDSALALRGEWHRARDAVAIMREAERSRSRTLLLLGRLTDTWRDSVALAVFQVSGDSTVRLVGYAPQAARVLADLEGSGRVGEARLEAPVSRERVGPDGAELDRFSLAARARRTW